MMQKCNQTSGGTRTFYVICNTCFFFPTIYALSRKRLSASTWTRPTPTCSPSRSSSRTTSASWGRSRTSSRYECYFFALSIINPFKRPFPLIVGARPRLAALAELHDLSDEEARGEGEGRAAAAHRPRRHPQAGDRGERAAAGVGSGKL